MMGRASRDNGDTNRNDIGEYVLTAGVPDAPLTHLGLTVP